MVILDQSKPILLIFEEKKKPFVHCAFIIHKNGNLTCVQLILKLNSTSFMLNNIFCEMNGKKVIHCGGMGELSKFCLRSVISIFTWVSKYITWISKQ